MTSPVQIDAYSPLGSYAFNLCLDVALESLGISGIFSTSMIFWDVVLTSFMLWFTPL